MPSTSVLKRPLVPWQGVYLALFKAEAKQKLVLRNVVMWNEEITDEDLISGAACKVFITFIEKYMLAVPLGLSDKFRGRRQCLAIAVKWHETIMSWPANYFQENSLLAAFFCRLRCIGWLAGDLPGVLNGTINDVEKTSKDGSELSKLIKASPWAAPLMRQAWMLDAAEGPVWPLLDAEFKRVGSDSAEEQDAAIGSMVRHFPEWKLAIRDTAFPVAMKEPCIAIVQKRVAADSVVQKLQQHESELSAEDPELTVLLQHVRGLNGCFADVRLTVALAQLKPFADAVSKGKAYLEFTQACRDFLSLDLKEGGKSEEFTTLVGKRSAELFVACPKDGGGMLITKEDDKKMMASLVYCLGVMVLQAWPQESMIPNGKALLMHLAASAEIAEPQSLHDGKDDTHVGYHNDGKDFLSATKGLEATFGYITAYEAMAPTLAERVEAEGAETIIKNLLASLDSVMYDKFPASVRAVLREAEHAEVLTRATLHTVEFRAHVIATAEQPLHAAKVTLQKIACGLPGSPSGDERRWDHIAEASGGKFASFDDLMKRTTDSLQQVRRADLIVGIKKCSEVCLMFLSQCVNG